MMPRPSFNQRSMSIREFKAEGTHLIDERNEEVAYSQIIT